MATSLVYNIFMQKLVVKGINLDTDTFKARLCMLNSRCGESDGRDADTLTALDALTSDPDGTDVFNGTVGGVAYADVTLANPSIANDAGTDSDDILEWSGDNITFSTVDGGDRDIQGVLLYESGGGIPICYIKFPTPIATDASDLTIKWNSGASSGTILKLQQG